MTKNEHLVKPTSEEQGLGLFHPAVREWFEAVFPGPTQPQIMGWPSIARGESTLILAPTGTGKTLAAFLWCINRIMRIIVKTLSIWAVAFNVPIAEFHNLDTLRRRDGFRSLGQDVLAEEFDASISVASLRARGDLQVGEALLTQSLMAGLGNVFKSEVCFACGINPFRPMETLRDDEVACLVRKARQYMLPTRKKLANGNRKVLGRQVWVRDSHEFADRARSG